MTQTPTVTPTVTIGLTPTAFQTPTPTATPTRTPPINVTFINNTTGGTASIDSFQDINGVVSLNNQIGTFPVLSTNRLSGYQTGTGNQPNITISGTVNVNVLVVKNGVTTISGDLSSGSLPTNFSLTSSNVPLLSSDVLTVTLSQQ